MISTCAERASARWSPSFAMFIRRPGPSAGVPNNGGGGTDCSLFEANSQSRSATSPIVDLPAGPTMGEGPSLYRTPRLLRQSKELNQ